MYTEYIRGKTWIECVELLLLSTQFKAARLAAGCCEYIDIFFQLHLREQPRCVLYHPQLEDCFIPWPQNGRVKRLSQMIQTTPDFSFLCFQVVHTSLNTKEYLRSCSINQTKYSVVSKKALLNRIRTLTLESWNWSAWSFYSLFIKLWQRQRSLFWQEESSINMTEERFGLRKHRMFVFQPTFGNIWEYYITRWYNIYF